MKFSLFTTKITESCYSENNKLFLGKWCLASELETNKLGEYKIAEYHWDNSKKIDKDYKYLYEFYYQTLDVLSKHLNRMHKRNEDQRTPKLPNVFLLRPHLTRNYAVRAG